MTDAVTLEGALEPEGLQIGHWPAFPAGVALGEGVDVDADDPAMGKDGKRTCCAHTRAGNRCGAPAIGDRLLCSMHDGRADPVLAAQKRQALWRERRERAERRVEDRTLGTRAHVNAVLADEHENLEKALRHLAERAGKGDMKAAYALLPWMDQALGKPTERVEHSAPTSVEDVAKLDTTQLEALVAEGRSKRLEVVQDDAA